MYKNAYVGKALSKKGPFFPRYYSLFDNAETNLTEFLANQAQIWPEEKRKGTVY
jgi:hypothetical protein